MKLVTIFLILALTTIPLQTAAAGQGTKNVVTITSDHVTSAVDIESAIQNATAHGSRPGTVILDGRKGPFILTGDDKSINIFVSNLTLRGMNNAVIRGCDDGLFFDDLQPKHILVEEISFICTGDGVEARATSQDVTLKNNLFQTGLSGISIGPNASQWLITGNTIQAATGGIWIQGSNNIVITRNQISGFNGIFMLQNSNSRAQQNDIHARYEGVLLGQASKGNLVQSNSILGVSAAGVTLEPDVTGNRVLANRVLCGSSQACLTVEASPETAEVNLIAGNRP